MSNIEQINQTYMDMVRRKRLYGGIMLAVFVALMLAGFRTADASQRGQLSSTVGIASSTSPPRFWAKQQANWPSSRHISRKYAPSLLETINIAAASTLLGALGAVILSLLATRGMARWPRLIPVFRRVLDIMRAVPEIVIALVLIFVLGGGPVPAMIAIAFHTVGALGKLFSEVNENASLKPVEGLSSVGASWAQRMVLGVIPQVAPNYLSYALLRFEINIRASAILGFVGAGGIGYELKNAMTWGKGQYDEAAAIFLMLFATIVVVDQLSSALRDRLTHGKKSNMIGAQA